MSEAPRPPLPTLKEQELAGKRVLVRCDFNVPLREGHVANDARIRASLPTLKHVLKAGGKLRMISHLGRPHPSASSTDQARFSLAPVARHLGSLLGREIRLVPWEAAERLDDNPHPLLMENLRFLPGESDCEDSLARRFAGLCDLFVLDAFAAAHRNHASTCGVVRHAPAACAGFLLQRELNMLDQVLEKPARPLVAVIGGIKLETKLPLLEHFHRQADHLIPGGGIANTLLAAAGYPVGNSVYSRDLCAPGKALPQGEHLFLPEDVVVCDEQERVRCVPASEVGKYDKIMDLGPKSMGRIVGYLEEAGTILWNGPLGKFEDARFAAGTRALAEAVARSNAFSLAGGGDTWSAAERFGVVDGISYISTGGGAFLEALTGRELPAVRALRERCQSGGMMGRRQERASGRKPSPPWL